MKNGEKMKKIDEGCTEGERDPKNWMTNPPATNQRREWGGLFAIHDCYASYGGTYLIVKFTSDNNWVMCLDHFT